MFVGRTLLNLALVFCAVTYGNVLVSQAESKDGDSDLQPIEKVAVFPVLYEGERGERLEQATVQAFDDTWWQVREELTDTGRITVASRAFLQKADAFQPRGLISTGDAVILGRYVEADAVMTIYLRGRNFTISVWDTNAAARVWSQSVELHPSVSIREQIAKVARAMVREFIAAIPYQGITVQDSLARQALVEDSGRKIAKVKIGSTQAIAVGDPVQWVQLERVSLDPLFQGGLKAVARAEGVVISQKDQILKVELIRVARAGAVRAGAVVQLSKEAERLAVWARPRGSVAENSMVAAVATSLSNTAAIEPEGIQMLREEERKKPVATTLSIIGSLAVVLLLAF